MNESERIEKIAAPGILYPESQISYDVDRQGCIVKVTKRYRQPIPKRLTATAIYADAATAAKAEHELKNNAEARWWFCWHAMRAWERKNPGEKIFEQGHWRR